MVIARISSIRSSDFDERLLAQGDARELAAELNDAVGIDHPFQIERETVEPGPGQP